MKRNPIIWILLFLLFSEVALSAPEQEAIPEETQAPEEPLQETIQEKVVGLAKSGIRAIPYVGTALSDLLFGAPEQEQLKVQRQILKTNRSTLGQIKAVAQSAMATQRKLEELDRLRREGLEVAQSLKALAYAKAIVGLTEEGLEISADPSAYIPTTPYTRQLKAQLSVSYSKDRRGVQRAGRFLKHTTKALGLQPSKPRSLAALQKELAEGGRYDRTLQAYTASRKLALAQHYEAQAEELLQGNQELQAGLERAGLSPSEWLAAYSLLHKNIQEATRMKERATALLEESATLSAADKAVLGAAADRALALELIEQELNSYK